MLKRSLIRRRHIRHFNNLADKFEGRSVAPFMFPYRHWAWKQGEVLRQVHEAQFEHMRKLYKRQWLDSFRVNADEYIHKYNITKAAQVAAWEHEMHAQEAKRKETMMMSQGREQLRRKHVDLLREYHERQFFHWFERASERLQYMTRIPYVDQATIAEHIEAELNKYCKPSTGSTAVKRYPLNFVGQMPMVEDDDGNVVEVPEPLYAQHVAERVSSTARPYAPGRATSAEDALQITVISAAARTLFAEEDDAAVAAYGSDAVASTVNDMTDLETALEADKKTAKSMEETNEDVEIARKNYITRGKQGSKTPFRRAKSDMDSAVSVAPSANAAGTFDKTPKIRKKLEQNKLMEHLESLTEGGKLSIREASRKSLAANPEYMNPTQRLTGMNKASDMGKAGKDMLDKMKADEKKRKQRDGGGSGSKNF